MSANLQRAYAESKRVTCASGSSFPIAFRLVSQPRRDSLYAVYAFNRLLDDAADDAGSEAEKSARVDQCEMSFRSALKNCDGSSVFHAIADTIQRYELPLEPFFEMIEGMRFDVSHHRIRNDEELMWYCDRVAGAVGRMLVPLFGVSLEVGNAYAIATGRALQLTNILRDWQTDFEMGRIYLPESWWLSSGVTVEDFGQNRALIGPYLQRVYDEAKRYYELADVEVAQLEREKLRLTEALRAMYRLVFEAVHVSGFDQQRYRSPALWKRISILLQQTRGFRLD